jgi:hypothetical protein
MMFFGKTEKVFDIAELKRLMKSNLLQAKQYILTFFCKSSDGINIYYYEPEEDGKHTISSIENLNGIVYKSLDKLNKDILRQWFEQEVNETFKINSDPRAERFYISKKTGQRFINLSEGFLHKVKKPFDKFSEETKSGVNLILKHIHDTWCSGNQESSQYVVNWLSMALTGNKMPTALFLKSGEGTGKSILVSFFIKHVIGEALGLITSRCGQLLKFNSQILGKVLICLEELPTANKAEWHTVADYLKDLITGSKIDIERKFVDAVQVINLISLIILTNNENTIKFGKDARRYMMCDVSHDNVGNIDYFKKLSAVCDSKEVGEAFFMYLCENKDAIFNKFDPERLPMTENKLLIKEANSTSIIKFIKEVYLQNRQGIESVKKTNIKLSYLREQYEEYTTTSISPQKFKLALNADLPILKVIQDDKKGHEVQRIEFPQLFKWFTEKGFWNSKFDEFNDEYVPCEVQDTNDEITLLKKEIEELKKQLQAKQQVKPEPTIEELELELEFKEAPKQKITIVEQKKQPVVGNKNKELISSIVSEILKL